MLPACTGPLPTVDTAKAATATISVPRRPNVSASEMPASGPNGQPRAAMPMTAPSQKGVGDHCSCKKMLCLRSATGRIRIEETADGRHKRDHVQIGPISLHVRGCVFKIVHSSQTLLLEVRWWRLQPIRYHCTRTASSRLPPAGLSPIIPPSRLAQGLCGLSGGMPGIGFVVSSIRAPSYGFPSLPRVPQRDSLLTRSRIHAFLGGRPADYNSSLNPSPAKEGREIPAFRPPGRLGIRLRLLIGEAAVFRRSGKSRP